MSALIECVPHFSEGRDLEVIRKITAVLGHRHAGRDVKADAGTRHR
jgi:glutamate formiminotransferase